MAAQIVEDNAYFTKDNLFQTLLVSASCFFVILVYMYYKNMYTYWSSQNVKGPRPLPFIGNLLELLNQDGYIAELERRKKFGKVYGMFQGATPILVISDAELLNKICIKDFDVFPNHHRSEFANEVQHRFLFMMQDDTWKRARTIMSPTFTSGKIKKMFKLLDVCADDIVDCFGEQLQTINDEKSGIVDVKETFSFFTMDSITTCCYGIKLRREGSSNLKSAASRDSFIEDAMRIFEFRIMRLLAVTSAPKPLIRLLNIKQAPMSSYRPLTNKVKHLIETRRKSTKKLDDYLQLLLDAKLDDKMELNEMDLAENHHAGLTHESLLKDQERMLSEVRASNGGKATLTDLETLSNAVFLLAVGLETTATLLCNASYALAFHQDIQNKLYSELLKIVEYNEDKTKCTFSYEAVTSCQYLDAVVSETLRRLTAVLSIDRVASRDYYIEKYDIHVPKGGRLSLAFYSIMNDPEYWEKPEEFNPDRFMPGNKEKIVPGSYCPFGIGPRHCIGMRFSLTEAKLALAKVMMSYKFDPAPNTVWPPSLARSVGLSRFANSNVKISTRHRQ